MDAVFEATTATASTMAMTARTRKARMPQIDCDSADCLLHLLIDLQVRVLDGAERRNL